MAAVTAVVLLGLLAMAVQPSMQEGLINPLFSAPYKINGGSSAFGLVVTSNSAEKALNDSGILVVRSSHDILGRKFVVGTISVTDNFGVDVVYVKSANLPAINVGLTVQVLLDYFNIRGIIQFGSAASLNQSLSIGTVVAPDRIAHTGIWTWKKYGASNGQLVFGKYNTPVNGDNLLGSVDFGASEVYRDGKLEKNVFWISPNPRWLWLASKIEGVVSDLKVVSSDIYPYNEAYREFLVRQFEASTMDATSSAVALAASSNDQPFIVFRGISNTVGSDEINGALANANAVKAVKRFIYLATVPRKDFED